MNEPAGFLNIHKARGLTSHDVVAKIRRVLKLKKVGHAGTLDPLATGVLIVCVGNATRLSEYVMASTKHYTAQVHLGVTTDTYDAEGEVIAERDASNITLGQIETALKPFLGAIDQIPPMYSAIKQGGKKLYDLARAGQVVEREARRVTIEALTVRNVALPEFDLDVVCSAGTYIRSLAYDLGEVLGVGAYLAGLSRTASGAFTLENAVTLDELLQSSNWQNYLLPPETAMTGWQTVNLSPEEVEYVLHGRSIPAVNAPLEALARAVAPNGETIAVLRGTGDTWQPYKVFQG
jgi:tRNA pseudouridine55 synthase